MRYRYNRQLNPPAPFIHVHLGRPDGSLESRDIPAQLDTGADFTVLPTRLVEQLGLTPVGEVVLAGFGATSVVSITFLVSIRTRQSEPFLLEAPTSSDEANVLLGRDFLNHFRLVLDGPNLVLELQ